MLHTIKPKKLSHAKNGRSIFQFILETIQYNFIIFMLTNKYNHFIYVIVHLSF